MSSIVLRPMSNPDAYLLALRTHDLSGVDYTRISILTRREARAISGSHTGIYASTPIPVTDAGEESLPLVIERVPDREPGKAAWHMRIGDELVMRERDGTMVALRLNDSSVLSLVSHSKVRLAGGEMPDWTLRSVEDMEDRVIELRAAAKDMAAKAAKARSAWKRLNTAAQPDRSLAHEGDDGPR